MCNLSWGRTYLGIVTKQISGYHVNTHGVYPRKSNKENISPHFFIIKKPFPTVCAYTMFCKVKQWYTNHRFETINYVLLIRTSLTTSITYVFLFFICTMSHVEKGKVVIRYLPTTSMWFLSGRCNNNTERNKDTAATGVPIKNTYVYVAYMYVSLSSAFYKRPTTCTSGITNTYVFRIK